MPTDLKDIIYSGMRDGADLVAWAEPNAAAWDDPRVDAAGWRARGRTIPPELAVGVPLLLYAADEVPPTSLLAALVADVRPRVYRCDTCDRPMLAATDADHHLWINCAATTVVVVCCSGCRRSLDYALPGLRWR